MTSICVGPAEIPVEIIRPPKDVFEPPGSDVLFEVELNKDRVEVKWLRNNMPVVQGDKHQMMSEGKIHRLQVCEIRPRDQGEYRIIAKDKDAKAKLELAGKRLINVPDLNGLLAVAQSTCSLLFLQLRHGSRPPTRTTLQMQESPSSWLSLTAPTHKLRLTGCTTT